jgi:alpha,alpha-trehalase
MSFNQLPRLRPIPEFIERNPADLQPELGAYRQLLMDVRQTPEYPEGFLDGFTVANAVLNEGLTYPEVGKQWQEAKARGEDPATFLRQHASLECARLQVRRAMPGEDIVAYTDYMANEGLRHSMPQDTGIYRGMRNLVDGPGSRFIGSFPGDNVVVGLGKLRRDDIEGAFDTLENDIDQIMELGYPLNWNGWPSAGRTQWPGISFLLEGIAAQYGEKGDEVIAHYQRPLVRYARFFMEGWGTLRPGEQHRRLMRLPTGEMLFRFYDAERLVYGLEGEAKKARWAKFILDKLAACESKMDFAPGWQSKDYKTLEELRTTDIAPAYLQAAMVHLLRMAGYPQHAQEVADTLNRRGWRDIDETRGHYCDVLSNGEQTLALNAAMAYPLMVGGIVPYDRAIKTGNVFKEQLGREYGFIMSTATTGEQWDGDPEGDLSKKGKDRMWPAVNMWIAEAFLQAAIEAEAAGNDPGPLLEVAEMARQLAFAIEERFKVDGIIAEKYCASEPTQFVNGGEYAKKKQDEQVGFGMSIGAYRNLRWRDFAAEVRDPLENSWRQYTLRRSLGGLLVAGSRLSFA